MIEKFCEKIYEVNQNHIGTKFYKVLTFAHKMESVQTKNYCFTLNNYTTEDVDRLVELASSVGYIIFGKEIGESGTPHLQGFVQFKTRIRFNSAKAKISGRCHLEHARDVQKARDYCTKDGDFTEFGTLSTAGSRNDLEEFKNAVKGGMLSSEELRENHSKVFARYPRFCIEYIQDHTPDPEIQVYPLRTWQEELSQLLNRPPDDRKINFVVDLVGNTGKTWFAHYYKKCHNDVQILLPGKKADLAYCINQTSRVIFLDAPRCKQNEFIFYDFLEEMKNGYIFSGKYESRFKTLRKLHVVVLMNEHPDMEKLSQDRYNIITL
jgi:hypothetical protein